MLPQHTLAAMLGVSQRKLDLILNGHRKRPAGFEPEPEAAAVVDRLERAGLAAAEARAKVLRDAT